MLQDKIWLSTPHMGGTEQNYIAEAFAANWITSFGSNIDLFEKELEYFLAENSKVAVLNSGTAAIHLGLVLLGVQQNDIVICQSLTFVASANPIVYLGAQPVFVDSENETWNMCPKALEEAILELAEKGKKPKAIIAVNLYGMPYKVAEITAIASKYAIPVIEDSAEALGSLYKGKKCGTFGTISTLSFNGNKIITTSGGGALVTKSEALKEKAIFLATQAKDAAAHYQHSQIGYNYSMSNISAGIGRGQMEVLAQHVAARRAVHSYYESLFEPIEGVSVHSEPSADFYSNHWLTVILLSSYEKRESLRIAFEKATIETRPVWKPLHLQPVFKDCLFFGGTISEDLFERGLCLPSGSNLTVNDKERITAVITAFFT